MKRLVLVSVLLLVLGWLWYDMQSWWAGPGPAVESSTVEIGSGATVASIARQLADQQLLERSRLWQWVVRLKGRDGDIKRGEYLVEAGSSPAQLLQLLVGGKVRQYSITLPEGISLSEAIALLHRDPVLQASLTGPNDARILALVAPLESGEGLFFPDTYRFVRGDTDFDVLKSARQRMEEQLGQAWEASGGQSHYATAYEALVMASVVEKETGFPEERRRIAGVFTRRLQKGMRLQTDPTVIYGLGEDFDGNLRRRHLKDASNPYNSYRHHGLPPTPIALPGRAAIDAALDPAPGNELYFVARGDGSHQFSDTLEQHQAAVRTWQLKRVENYRSSPTATPAATKGEP